MKFLILFLISFNLKASYLPESKIGEPSEGLTIYLKKNKCEKAYSEPCIKINQDSSISMVMPAAQLKELAQDCTDQDDCQSKLEDLECSDETWEKIRTETEVYCTKFRPKKVVFDQAKKAAKDALIAERQAEREALKQEREEVRAVIQTIRQSDLPNWHKKTLIYLIKQSR